MKKIISIWCGLLSIISPMQATFDVTPEQWPTKTLDILTLNAAQMHALYANGGLFVFSDKLSGLSADIVNSYVGEDTLLIKAIRDHNLTVVSGLLAHKYIRLDLVDSQGFTPLEIAQTQLSFSKTSEDDRIDLAKQAKIVEALEQAISKAVVSAAV